MAKDFLSLANEDNPVQSVKEPIKHLLVGSPIAVMRTIQILHVQGYSEVGLWSKPVPAGDLGQAGEVVSVFTKQILLAE